MNETTTYTQFDDAASNEVKPETKPKTRKPHSEETKAKISASLKGNLVWNKGKQLSDEHKAKISEALTGRIFTDEWKEHMSQSQKLAYAEGRRANDAVTNESRRAKMLAWWVNYFETNVEARERVMANKEWKENRSRMCRLQNMTEKNGWVNLSDFDINFDEAAQAIDVCIKEMNKKNK